MSIPIRDLGRTGLQVTALGYGAMELRGVPPYPNIDPRDAQEILAEVLDSGINFIDTSIDYGLSEEFIGKFIAKRRSEFFLATKCGCPVLGRPSSSTPDTLHEFTRSNIIDGLHQSLKRLNTDYIDVLQCHAEPSKDILIRDQTIETLLDLKKQGLIRFIGMSSTLPNLADHIDMNVFDVFQIPYSPLQREHEDTISRAALSGAGIVIRGGIARGGPSKEVGLSWDTWKLAQLDKILEGMSRAEFTLRFTLTHQDVSTIIVGTKNKSHLMENLGAISKGPLPSSLYIEAKHLLTDAGIIPG